MQPSSEDALGAWRRPVSISRDQCRLEIIKMTLGEGNSNCATFINMYVYFKVWSGEITDSVLWASKSKDIDKSGKIIYKYSKACAQL